MLMVFLFLAAAGLLNLGTAALVFLAVQVWLWLPS
jgi:hypothetical protein